MKPSQSLFVFLAANALICTFAQTSSGQEEQESDSIVLYDNLDQTPNIGIHLFPGDNEVAQMFYTGNSDNVSAVSIDLKRTGNPGGKLIAEVWDLGQNDLPGKLLGTVSEAAMDSLSTSWDRIRFEGSVTGLETQKRYWLVLQHEDAIITNSRTYHFAPIHNRNGTNSPDGEQELKDIYVIQNGNWVLLSQFFSYTTGFLHAKIESAPPAIEEPLNADIDPAIAIRWDSKMNAIYQIYASTDMENWELALDAIEGTGERLTHCFIRVETEVYYRVEEGRE